MGLEEKLQILGTQISRKAQRRIQLEWQKLEEAKEGTLKNRAYRLAQAILAREDPQEVFLKSIPTEPADVEVIYPSSLTEKHVRRRLRVMLSDAHRRHRSRMLWWLLALVPQLPLMATPLPNVTVYYAGYRWYANYRALQGTKSLQQCFSDLDARQLRALRDDLLWYQEKGGELPLGLWPAKLIQKEKRYLDILSPERVWRRIHPDVPRKHPEAEATQPDPPTISFVPSVALSEFVKQLDRDKHPLDDDATMSISQYFGAPKLLEHVARARKRAVGSAFPMHYP